MAHCYTSLLSSVHYVTWFSHKKTIEISFKQWHYFCLRRALTSENSLLIKYDHHIDLLSDSSCCSDPVCTLQSAVRAVEADADLWSLGSEQDCVLPSRDSSFPEQPAPPYDEPACVWWRIQRFPPAETKPRAPVWERNKASFTSTSNYRPTHRPPLVFLVVSVILFLQSQNTETKQGDGTRWGNKEASF